MPSKPPEIPPSWLDYGATDDEGRGALRVGLHYGELDGRIECVGVEIWAARPPKRVTPDGTVDAGWRAGAGLVGRERPLRSTDVRIPLETMVRFELDPAVQARIRALIDAKTPKLTPAKAREASSSSDPALGRPRKYDRAALERAASVYQRALRTQQPATAAVAREFGISDTAASKLIARIRASDPGLLPPAKRRSRSTSRSRAG